MSAAPVLVTLMGGRVVGHVEQNLQGKLRFTYDQVWRDWPGAYPLSLSMPMHVACLVVGGGALVLGLVVVVLATRM